MNPHCLTAFTLDTAMIIITIIITIIIIIIIITITTLALITMLCFMTTICVTTTAMLQFIVQVNNDLLVHTNAVCLFMSNDVVLNASSGSI